jgi:hypothetical protein
VPYSGSRPLIGKSASCSGASPETSAMHTIVRIVKSHPRRHTASSANGTLTAANSTQNGHPVAYPSSSESPAVPPVTAPAACSRCRPTDTRNVPVRMPRMSSATE